TELWRAPCFENYDTQLDVFVLDGVVWVGKLRHRGDPGFTKGRDVRSGKVVATIPNNLKFYNVRMGHHRCYRNRATTRYLLLGRDGIEFVDPKNGTGTGCWWVRGTCQYGVMPANGLIYAPPHSCACHPAEKLNGFNVLAPRPAAADGPGALDEGPAYGADLAAQAEGDGQWPTYRRDARRSGFQDLDAPRDPAVAWSATLREPVTAPVAAGGRVFVAETERHTLRALSQRDGQPAWTFIADGRIDSPPTIAAGRCIFGTRNGFVYCLRAADGALAWRFHPAGSQRLVFAYERLESVWPVHGSVLIAQSEEGQAPVVYAAAGRSSHLDGGIRLVALDLATGKPRHQAVVTMNPGPETQDAIKQRALPGILSLQHGSLFLRHVRLDKTLAHQGKAQPHLYAPGGFLDDTWWHRTYWVYGTTMQSGYGGWPRVGNRVPAGRLLAFDGGDTIYGYGRMRYRAGAGHVHPDATRDYKLFAEAIAPEPDKKRRRKRGGGRDVHWAKELPFVARSVVLTRDALLVAGGGSLAQSADDHGPGVLWVGARKDGARRAACKLPAPPVLDGMAYTAAGIYLATLDGRVLCLRDRK
ncbi:MAG: PQQ-binding-like beta-propeller repeat protein, partial [bacterium]